MIGLPSTPRSCGLRQTPSVLSLSCRRWIRESVSNIVMIFQALMTLITILAVLKGWGKLPTWSELLADAEADSFVAELQAIKDYAWPAPAPVARSWEQLTAA